MKLVLTWIKGARLRERQGHAPNKTKAESRSLPQELTSDEGCRVKEILSEDNETRTRSLPLDPAVGSSTGRDRPQAYGPTKGRGSAALRETDDSEDDRQRSGKLLVSPHEAGDRVGSESVYSPSFSASGNRVVSRQLVCLSWPQAGFDQCVEEQSPLLITGEFPHSRDVCLARATGGMVWHVEAMSPR